jgi:hypothetical protein
LTQSHPTRLLTTRVRTGVALGLTAFVFALTILHWGHTKSGWLFTAGFALHGWLLMAVNVFFYGYVCWLGFWLIRGTAGPERLFMVGWFAGFLLSPLHTLGPQWAVAIKHIGAVGLAVALLAALSLLLHPSDVADSSGRTDAT